ncbi:MAG TPA: hypothetical protein VLJ15_02330 [Gammaproteobacteria bacterium]|nr:hypothetical protein [Gammaproteobacteria bacterium]
MPDSKKIKKNLYGKPQTIHAVFPAGMGETALDEVQCILNTLWFKQKYTSECSLLKNGIRITPVHLFAVTELLMRSQSLSDIRLIIFEGSATGKESFRKKCAGIHWDFFLDKNMSLKIKVNSVASRAFHETGLKEMLCDILKEHVSTVVSGENTDETTCLYVDLYKNKLTVSLSLAGDPLYRRGYRERLSASAPLREDAAFCCLMRAIQFANRMDPHFLPDSLFVPFSGTGTFVFEYLQHHFKFSPVLFSRDYALTHMPFFNDAHFNFLLKKAAEKCLKKNVDADFICMDYSKNAMSAFLSNLDNVKNAFQKQGIHFPEDSIRQSEEDFFKADTERIVSGKNIFMPLNPPYGIRMGKTDRPDDFYKKIANKINDISKIISQSGKKCLGFILCPDEKTWSCFLKTIKNMKTETYHFTQGGLDIRVCQFFS